MTNRYLYGNPFSSHMTRSVLVGFPWAKAATSKEQSSPPRVTRSSSKSERTRRKYWRRTKFNRYFYSILHQSLVAENEENKKHSQWMSLTGQPAQVRALRGHEQLDLPQRGLCPSQPQGQICLPVDLCKLQLLLCYQGMNCKVTCDAPFRPTPDCFAWQ